MTSHSTGEPSCFGSSETKVGDTWPKALALSIISSLSPQGILLTYRGSAEAEGLERRHCVCHLVIQFKGNEQKH